MNARAQGLELSSTALPGHNQDIESEAEQPRHEPTWNPAAACEGPAYNATAATMRENMFSL